MSRHELCLLLSMKEGKAHIQKSGDCGLFLGMGTSTSGWLTFTVHFCILAMGRAFYGLLMTVMGKGNIWRSSRALGLYGWVYIQGSVGPLHILITVCFPLSSTFARTDA